MATKFDVRQSISRDSLDQIVNATDKELDDILRAVNAELTVPLRIIATSTPDLTITIENIELTNPETAIRRTISPIGGNAIPVFGSGTVVFPAASGGAVTVTPGTNTTLTVSSGNFIKAGIALDVFGDIVVSFGTEGASEAAATIPVISSSHYGIGIIVLENVAGTIQNVAPTAILQFTGGAGGGSASDLQEIYNNSTSPELIVDGTRGALTIQDNSTPIAANLFEVEANGGGTQYLEVDVSKVTVNNLETPGTIDKSSAAALDIGGTNATTLNLSRSGQTTVIKGDLQVDGTTTTVNSTTLDVADANITINDGGNQATADDTAGITVEMSDATDAKIVYDKDVASRFKVGDAASESEIIVAAGSQTITGPLNIATASGSMGVGTTSPDTQLHVQESGSTLPTLPTGNVAGFQRSDSGSNDCRVLITAGATGKSTLDFGDTVSSTVGGITYNHADDTLEFNTNSTNDRITIENNGQLTVAAQGIKLPDGSSTLNAYQEGTWTPVYSSDTNIGGTASFTAGTHKYTRIGRVVTVVTGLVTGLTITSNTAGDTQLVLTGISGLPGISANSKPHLSGLSIEQVSIANSIPGHVVALSATAITIDIDGRAFTANGVGMNIRSISFIYHTDD